MSVVTPLEVLSLDAWEPTYDLTQSRTLPWRLSCQGEGSELIVLTQTPANHEEKKLLQNILFALGVPVKTAAFWFLSPSDVPDLCAQALTARLHSFAPKRLLCLGLLPYSLLYPAGEAFANMRGCHDLNGLRVCITASLSSMIGAPETKAAVWQDIYPML